MTTLDDVARQLREWRIAAGSPSYAELARRVGELRAAGDQQARVVAPGRVTVYDCFRDGRSRIDVALVLDLAAVLGIEGREYDDWRERCAEAMRPRTHGVVTSSSTMPVPVEPGIDAASHLGGPAGLVGPAEAAGTASGGTDSLGTGSGGIGRLGNRVLFAGIGGSGKTQAAIRLLHRLRAEGRIDGVLTVRLDGPEASASTVMNAAAHELEIRLPGTGAAERLLSILARRRLALLIDDVAEADQVAPIVAPIAFPIAGPTVGPAGPADESTSEPIDGPVTTGAPTVIATSRRALDLPGMTRIDLAPWTVGEVSSYLTQVVGERRTSAEPAAAADLAELTGGLPLAAALVAARVREAPNWSLADHAAALRERREGDRIEDALRASMDSTHAALSLPARELWSLLASGPRSGLTTTTTRAVQHSPEAPVVAESARATSPNQGMATEADPMDEALEELQRAYVLNQADQRHQLHDIARGYARGWALEEEPPSTRAAREDRLIDRFCAEAWGVARALSPSDFDARRVRRQPVAVASPQAWLATDLPGALELTREARARRPEAVIELSEAVATSVERTGLALLSEELHAAARDAAVANGDAVGEARARCALAISAMRRDDPDVPLDEITALATRVNDSWTLARLSNLRGIFAMRAGDGVAGMQHFRDGVDLAAAAGHRALAPAIAGNLALALTYAGDLDGALRWTNETLAGSLAVGNIGQAATALCTRSETQRLLGHMTEAVSSAEEAVGYAEQIGDQLALTHSSINLGKSLTLCDRAPEAIPWLHRAETTAADIGLVEVEATVHVAMGEALLATGDACGAAARFEAALSSHSDSPIDPATALHHLGTLAIDRDPAEARGFFDRALAQLGDGFEQVAATIRADRDALP